MENVYFYSNKELKYNEYGILTSFPLDDLKKLLNTYYIPVKSELRRLGCPSVIFEDVYQDVFFILIKKEKSSGTAMRNPQSYITQMCKYIWFKERRRQGKHVSIEESMLAIEPETGTRDEMKMLLSKHMNNLSSTCKEILTLYSEGYSEDKIGRILNLGDRNAVKNKKYYCKETLKSMIVNDPLFKEING